MSCIYKYKNKIYTESQIKDLILERDILKNHPIVTFIKKLFKTLPFQYKENLLNEGSKKYGIERGESTATIKYSLADQNKVEYGLKAIEILHSDKAIQIFEKGKKNNWSLDKILTELQIPKEQKQLILDLGITDREKIALELASKYSFVVEINTAKKEYSKNYTRGNQTPTEDRPYGNNTFEINNVEYSSNIMDGGYKKYENGKYYNITAEEYKKAFDSFEKTYETIPTIYYSNLTVHGGTNYTENEISTPLITPSIKGHTLFSTNNGIGWFRSDDKVDGLDTNIYDSKDIPAGIMNVTGEYGEFFRKEKGGDWYVSTNEGDINVSKTAMPDEFITDAFNEQYSINRNKLQLTKVRRILEIQSDFFQKGRNQIDLTPIRNKFIYTQVSEEEHYEARSKGEFEFLDNSTTIWYDENMGEYKESTIAGHRYNGKLYVYYQGVYPAIVEEGVDRSNQFLQLLNKNNNWVTFFIKSIIQDTAKQTITEVQQEDVEAKVRELEKEGLLEIDCKGKLKAEKGLTTSFTKGGTWKVIKDLKGYPTHKEGGVDLTIGKDGVSIKNGNTQFTAKHGLVIPKKGKEDVEHWKNVYKNNKRLPQYVWNYYTPQEQIKYFGTTKENNISNIKGLTVFNSLLKNKTAYGNFASGDASVAVNNKDYFEITNLYKSGKIKRAEYLDKLYSNAINTSDDSKYIHKGGSNPPVRPLNINSSQDALNIFLGKPQEYDSFSISNYKPSNSKNSDSYYYKLNREEEIENELFNTSKNVLTGEDNFLNSKETERYVKGSHLGEASLKNFKLSKGKDERGDYVSYYDINDYGNVLDIAGKPFEIYNRIYLKDYGDGKQKRMYYSDKELSELDVNKKNFDTLALQRELSNRGYKLPKSTKKDGTFDGVWGDETKNAFLEYIKSQNKNKE